MHIIHSLLQTESRRRYFIAEGQLDVPKLRSVGGIFIHSMAWSMTRSVMEALAAIEKYPDFEPTRDELADRLLITDYGHWREVVSWAGYLTLKFKLEADLESEIQLLQTTITLAAVTGRRVVGLIPVNVTPPMASDFAIVVQRDGYADAVWLDLEYNACPEDPDGLHHIGCGCEP